MYCSETRNEVFKWQEKLAEAATALDGDLSFVMLVVQDGVILGDTLLPQYNVVTNDKNGHKTFYSKMAQETTSNTTLKDSCECISDNKTANDGVIQLKQAPWELVFVFSKKKLAYMEDFGVCIL